MYSKVVSRSNFNPIEAFEQWRIGQSDFEIKKIGYRSCLSANRDQPKRMIFFAFFRDLTALTAIFSSLKVSTGIPRINNDWADLEEEISDAIIILNTSGVCYYVCNRRSLKIFFSRFWRAIKNFLRSATMLITLTRLQALITYWEFFT